MITFAHNDVQCGLLLPLHLLDTDFQDVLRLVHELAVEVDLVILDAARGVVLAEDELGGLLVEAVHCLEIVAVVGLSRLGAQAVVVAFCVGAGAMIERCVFAL